MKKSIVFLTIVLALTVSACSGQAPSAGGKVTLRLWSNQDPGFQKANQTLIDQFMQQNPDIQVKYETFSYDDYIQTLQTSMAAGNEADVLEIFGTWVCSYGEGGRLLEVPADTMTYAQAQEIYYPSPLNGYYCGGKLYGFPQEFNLENGGALVNPALFEKHNVTYPPKWSTFADMIADAQKMTEFDASGNMVTSGFDFITGDGLPFTLLGGILEQGSSYFASDGRHFNFDTPEARKTIQFMVDLAQQYKVVDPILFNDTTNAVSTSFFTGNIAVGFVGSWAAGTGVSEYPDMQFGYVEIPTYFGGERHFATDSGWGKVVSAHTKHPAEAWKLAQFMATVPENAMSYNIDSRTIPALKALVAKPDDLLAAAPYMQATFDLLPHGQYIGDLTNRDQLFYEIIYPHVLEAMQGVDTVDGAVQKINEEANAMVDGQ
jgi:multiple sugar transport system substrate-binding protein